MIIKIWPLMAAWLKLFIHCFIGMVFKKMKIDKPRIYEIRLEGELSDRWSDWFDGLSIHKEPNGETLLTGCINDQASLLGVLSKLQALNVTLISAQRATVEQIKA